jgi:hypothetical protein
MGRKNCAILTRYRGIYKKYFWDMNFHGLCSPATPELLQHSNWGEAPNLSTIQPVNEMTAEVDDYKTGDISSFRPIAA